MHQKGFTLIEMLIVIGIISLLIAMEAFIYGNSQKSARDGKRKADLENIRAALEQYRSANNTYPQTLNFPSGCTVTVNNSFSDNNNNTYMNPLPSDPYCQFYHYFYSSYPLTCDDTGLTTAPICNDYTLGAYLEKNSSPQCATNCGNQTCNYCLGPYGTK